jgi:hypothetical protein
VAQRVGRSLAELFHDRGTRKGRVVSSVPLPHFTPGKVRYPLHRRLGGPCGQNEWEENLVPIGIRSRTVQPVVSRYTDQRDNCCSCLKFNICGPDHKIYFMLKMACFLSFCDTIYNSVHSWSKKYVTLNTM